MHSKVCFFRVKALCPLLLVTVLWICLFSHRAHAANDWNLSTGILILRDPITNNLQQSIEDTIGSADYGQIRQLTLLATATPGGSGYSLNQTDLDFIKNKKTQLTALGTLDLSQTLTSGDLILINDFMSGHTVISDISMPPGVTQAGDDTFYNCSALRRALLPGVTAVGSDAFYNCVQLTEISLPQAHTIGIRTFMNCGQLTEVDLPLTTDIGWGAFYNCIQLSNIILPKATHITWNTFYNTSVTHLELPSVQTVEAFAINNCTALETIHLPQVILIEDWTFNDCTNLKVLFLGKTPPAIEVNAFGNTPLDLVIRVPENSKKNYENNALWVQFAADLLPRIEEERSPTPPPGPTPPGPTPSGASPRIARYDAAYERDILFTLLGSAGLLAKETGFSVQIGETELRKGEDYSVSGRQVTLKNSWLKRQNDGQYRVRFVNGTLQLTEAKLIVTGNGTSASPIGEGGSGGCNMGFSLFLLLAGFPVLYSRHRSHT